MSMENAILEHAGALKELAAAIRSMGTFAPSTLAGFDTAMLGAGEQLVQGKAAELAGATEQRAAAAREALKKDQDAETAEAKDNQAGPTGDTTAEAVKAVSDEIEAKGTVLPDDTAANLAEVEKQNAPADLDYAKDVRPVLLAAIKKAGKDAVAAMIGKYGVDKADKLKPEQLPAVLAEAQALAA